MKKILSGIGKFAMCLWQLPQEVVAFYLLMIYARKDRITKTQKYGTSTIFRIHGFKGGLSLSRFIFVQALDYDLVRHEYGHSRQSKFLGPLYLLVIGLPSLIWAWLYSDSWKKSYYWFYTERWADRLGGLRR